VLDPRIGGLWGWQFANVVGARAFCKAVRPMSGREGDERPARLPSGRCRFSISPRLAARL
jgi:hypothetical protein